MAGLASTAPVGFVCAACGYEILVEDPARACPMCQAVTWDSTTLAPFGNPDHGRAAADVIDLAEYRLRRSQLPQAKGAR